MRKIALIMDGWKRFFTYAWPAGILQRIRESKEDVNLYIFNSSGAWSRDDEYNTGEYNIYRLPDLNDFDGIILDLNNIRYPKVREYVVKAAKATGKPVISIANEIEDFYYVGIDNYSSIREIIEHLHQKHSCKTFWFIMAAKDNYENSVRVRALKDYLQEHRISYAEDDFYFESYDYQCGYRGFLKLYETHQKMPDAIICANDNIAVGCCEAASAKGFRAPEDFLVTGFDDFDKASFYSPHITTVSHVREEVGYQCAQILLKIWSGQKVGRFNYTESKSIFWESCGCTSDRKIDHRRHAKDQLMYGIETEGFEEQILSLEYELMRCNTVREMTICIQKCFPTMKCDAIYLILDAHMNDYRHQEDYFDKHLLENEEFHIYGYPEKMQIEFAYENGGMLDCVDQQITGLFPMFEYNERATDFLFMPLHFRNRTVGYFVIRNAIYLMEKQYLFQILNAFTSAMENLHKKEKVEYMNQVLSELYVRDALTGLYNRMGYRKLAAKLFREKKEKLENLLIMFIDMDRLKYINDHFGHEYGDIAIKTIAGAILHYCPEGAIPVRTGGDEFLLILPMMDDGELEDFKKNVREKIHETAKAAKIPFELTISIGSVRSDMTSDKVLDDYIREADAVMYEEKMRKKVERRE